MPIDIAYVHETQWRGWFGSFDGVAGYRPTQTERPGFAVLLIEQGRPVGFVKARPGWDPELEVGACLSVQSAETFWAPKVVGVHAEAGWTSLGTTAIPAGLHSPRLAAPITAICDEVSTLLGDLGITGPADWLPMHGDMGPWNLRQPKGQRPVLFDWENVAYAPPHADLVFHEAACRAVGLKSSADIEPYRAARNFWISEIQGRVGSSERDVRLADEMLKILGTTE